MRLHLLRSSLLAAILALASPGIQAQSRNLDLGSIFDTAKNLAKSQSVGSP
jgi:parvulin-like peptidyl-prolyl isomerase